MMKKIIKWGFSKSAFNQDMKQSCLASKDGHRKLMASLAPLFLVLTMKLFLWMIMDGNPFVDDNETPSVDDKKSPRLMTMKLLLWMMMEIFLLMTMKLILWIIMEIPMEQKEDKKEPKMNKVLRGQSNQCGCGKKPAKEKQYKYKYGYKFKYKYEYEHKCGNTNMPSDTKETLPFSGMESGGGKKAMWMANSALLIQKLVQDNINVFENDAPKDMNSKKTGHNNPACQEKDENSNYHIDTLFETEEKVIDGHEPNIDSQMDDGAALDNMIDDKEIYENMLVKEIFEFLEKYGNI